MALAKLYITIASIPPMAMAVFVIFVYTFFAAHRWTWTMLPDAGLLGLYLWRPSIPMLAFVLWLGVIRHTPALAREFVRVFWLDEHVGMTDRLIRFLLPAAFPPAIITSSQPAAPTQSNGLNPVYIPVSWYGMADAGMPETAADSADIDQESAPTIPLSHNLTERSLIAAMAVLKDPANKKNKGYKWSANDIAKKIGGDRNAVMALIREIRDGPAAPVFPPRTADQNQVRRDLGLDT